MLPPLSLSLRSGGFLFDSLSRLSISRLSPRAPRFVFIQPGYGHFLFFPVLLMRQLIVFSAASDLPPGYSLLHLHPGPCSSHIRTDRSVRSGPVPSSLFHSSCTSCSMGRTCLFSPVPSPGLPAYTGAFLGTSRSCHPSRFSRSSGSGSSPSCRCPPPI